MSYNHQEIEKKWQKRWEEDQVYRTPDAVENKFYSLGMFPYPSGDGLHIGHPKGYTANDIWARYKRALGYQVLMPMGWDSFGLPAENYAIKTGIHPAKTTKNAIDNFRQQLKSIGLSYDWQRELSTSNPIYYKWTQWIFLKLLENNLAYQREAPVNWCPGCQTVLANEQVKDGLCERCSSKVVQKELKQWFFRITQYADELIDDLESLDWPESIKAMQRNWIGRSSGAIINFKLENSANTIQVFTTRPDTLFGVTYLVVAPEHDLIKTNLDNLSFKVRDYIEDAANKSELDRQAAKDKSGVYTGLNAVHPATGKNIPIWVGDYVLTGYGTGAVMAVPAHDERDFEFANKYELPVINVVENPNTSDVINGESKKPYINHGRLIRSQDWNGFHSEFDRQAIIDSLVKLGIGEQKTTYRLRDWLVSRQRYWGPPIPVLYCEDGSLHPVDENDLPVQLPTDVDFKPTGQSPLKESKEFHNVKCSKCDGKARREVDTLDTFVDSSWYFLRYLDTNNESELSSREQVEKWLPVDLYVGGAEHAVLHLLYARFITKALDDIVGLGVREPFKKLVNVGLIRAEDGQKMSKSRGNVINPDEIVSKYGADSLRVYEMFMGPFEESVQWDPKALIGVRRWLDRVNELVVKVDKYEILNSSTEVLNEETVASYQVKDDIAQTGHFETDPESRTDDPQVVKLIEQTIDKVTSDIEDFKFNTAISAMMIASNKLKEQKSISRKLFSRYLQVLAPFAPHLAQELWEQVGNVGYLDTVKWPEAKVVEELEVTIIVQVDGKFRGKMTIAKNAKQMEIEQQAQQIPNVAKFINGKESKAIYVPNKLVNFLTS